MIQNEEVKNVDTSEINYSAVLKKLRTDKKVSVEFAKKALTSVGYESSLLELNGVV